MKKIVIPLVTFLILCGSAFAGDWYGPGDTVKIPFWITDSSANPIAIDSASDSMYVRVWSPYGADTSYFLRGLIDASTNTSIRTSKITTFGTRTWQTFDFFKIAYTLTGNATTSGVYKYQLVTWDASLGLFKTFNGSFQYVYPTSGGTAFAYATALTWVDSTPYYWSARSLYDSSTTAGNLAALYADSLLRRDTTRETGAAGVTVGEMILGGGTGGGGGINAAGAALVADTLLNRNMGVWAAGSNWPKLGKFFYNAGDSTNYVNQYDAAKAVMDSARGNPLVFNDMTYISGDATAAANLEAALDGTGGVTMKLLQLDLGGAAGSNGALYVHNSTGPAIYGLTTASNYNAMTLASSGATGAGSGLYLSGAPQGYGLMAFGGTTSGHGVWANAPGTGSGMLVSTSSTSPGLSVTSGGDAVRFTAGGNGSGINATGAGSGSGIAGTGGTTGSGMMLSGYLYGLYAGASQLGGAAFFGYAPQGHAFDGLSYIGEPNFHGMMDSVIGVGSGGGGGLTAFQLDSVAEANPGHFYGPTNSGTGLTFGVNIWVVDTGATPDAGIQATNVSIVTLAGAFVSGGQTNDSGVVRLSADAGTYQIRAFRPPFSMTVKTIIVTADVDSTQIPAYNGITGSKCMVWGSLVDYGLNAVRYVPVTFTFAEAINPSDGSILINRTVKATSGIDGSFNATLIRSSKLQNKPWTMTIGEGASPLKRQIIVLDSTSQKIAW